ncbi:hypothetical protein ACTHGU_20745 [Chitinophagaceae bacterium MMS25-I14]
MRYLFFRFPVLFIVLGLFLALNNVFGWYPSEMQHGALAVVVPCIAAAFGVGGILARRYQKKQLQKAGNTDMANEQRA